MEKLKILVVDDEAGVLMVIKGLIQGHDLTMEMSPNEAAKLIQREKFDIFIIDYQLGNGMTGIDLLELIHEEYRENAYVSIFLTAVGTMYLFKEEKAQKLFDFHVEKPFETDDFLKIFNKAVIELGRRRSKG